jgi:hypothetical protein
MLNVIVGQKGACQACSRLPNGLAVCWLRKRWTKRWRERKSIHSPRMRRWRMVYRFDIQQSRRVSLLAA